MRYSQTFSAPETTKSSELTLESIAKAVKAMEPPIQPRNVADHYAMSQNTLDIMIRDIAMVKTETSIGNFYCGIRFVIDDLVAAGVVEARDKDGKLLMMAGGIR